MKAIQIIDYGSTDVFEMCEISAPEVSYGEIKVRVKAVSRRRCGKMADG